MQKVMSKRRFETIGKYLHLVDNETLLPKDHPDYDKFCKVRPLIDACHQTFKKFKPGVNLSIDEAMIAFKGRCAFLQYMPKKVKKSL